jgi:hypothetical protein
MFYDKMSKKKGRSKSRPAAKRRGNSRGDYLDLAKPGEGYKFRKIGPGMAIPPYKFNEKIHEFRMTVPASAFKTKTNLTGSQIKGAAAAYGFALAWSAVDMPFNFSTLFDQYRLKEVNLVISSSKNTNTTGLGSLLYVVKDIDNSTLFGSAAQAQTYASCTTVRGSDAGEGESLIVHCIPCVPVPSILGSLVLESPWQDLAVNTNTHYGIKGWYATAAATDPVWDVEAQYVIECRNTQ